MKMKRLLLSVLLFLLFALPSFAGTDTLVGTVRSSSGDLFNGTLRFFLPFAGAVDTNCNGGSCAILPSVVTVPVTNGVPNPVSRLTRNGDIQPGGTYYKVHAYDNSGNWLEAFNIVIPAGGPTFDIGAALQTTIITQNISYISPANLNGNNTWTGTNTFNGPVNFGSTVTGVTFPCSTVATANTVCGNNTGSPAAPAYVKVTFGMTDGTTIAGIASPVFTGTPSGPTPPNGDSSTRFATTAWFQNQVGTGLVIGSASIASSCALALVNAEWSCSGTFSWGSTLPITNYKVACSLGLPSPGGSYPIPAGYDTMIYVSAKTATQFTYTLNDDHSGSNGAVRSIDCIATR